MNKLDKINYVGQAEQVIKDLLGNKKILTKNQIRNILALINELYDMVRLDTSETLSIDIQSHIQYVKMKIVYAAGKDGSKDVSVKEFVNKSHLLDYLDSVGSSRKELMLVCHYMESLVAYHSFYNKE